MGLHVYMYIRNPTYVTHSAVPARAYTRAQARDSTSIEGGRGGKSQAAQSINLFIDIYQDIGGLNLEVWAGGS